MWFFTSPRNPYRETIEAKRTRRAEALKHAPAFLTEVHQKYLDVTGDDFFFPREGYSKLLIDLLGACSITDSGEYIRWKLDCVGSVGGLYCACGTGAAGDELPH